MPVDQRSGTYYVPSPFKAQNHVDYGFRRFMVIDCGVAVLKWLKVSLTGYSLRKSKGLD